jgi:hypothetical protein
MIIGFDFSINKPAACLFNNGKYSLLSWPFEHQKERAILESAGVKILTREDKKYKDKDSSKKMQWEVENSMYLANLITGSLTYSLSPSDTYIAFEGLSYNSSGNMAIQLGGYKYMLMRYLFDDGILFSHMETYAPITIKKTAGCSQKGKKKEDMIRAFIESGVDLQLRHELKATPEKFQKRTGTWIEHLDDLVDAFWAVETFREKFPHLY